MSVIRVYISLFNTRYTCRYTYNYLIMLIIIRTFVYN